jgi:hypothetical protein
MRTSTHTAASSASRQLGNRSIGRAAGEHVARVNTSRRSVAGRRRGSTAVIAQYIKDLARASDAAPCNAC